LHIREADIVGVAVSHDRHIRVQSCEPGITPYSCEALRVMTIRRIFAMTAAAGLSVGPFCAPAMADDGGFYIGANLGHVLSTYRRHDMDDDLSALFGGPADGFGLNSSSLRKSHAMWSADVGYMLSPYVGVEASYLDLGSLKYSAAAVEPSATGVGTAPVTVDLDIKSRGPALALVGTLPMSNLWELDARAGAYEGKQISNYLVAGETGTSAGTQSKTSTSLLAGVGGSVTLTSHFTVRLDLLRLQHLDEEALAHSFDVNLVTVGVNYFF
jgi:hypothetical protein